MKALPTIRIVLADDYEMYREGFKVMLKNQDSIELVGEAENGKELLELVRQLKPDIAITDINMPIMDGIAACKVIRKEYPDTKVIALSMYNTEHMIIDMLEAGAKGYLEKNTNKNELIHAARAVYEGYTYYCPSTSEKLTQMIAASKFNPYRKKEEVEFTPTELRIIQMVCEQASNQEIAEKINISVRTVEKYRNIIMDKMDVKNSVGIAVYALKNKLVEL